jgi:hypothetical protein
MIAGNEGRGRVHPYPAVALPATRGGQVAAVLPVTGRYPG